MAEQSVDAPEEAVGCADVQWPEAKRTDAADKFEAAMRNADVLLVVSSFSRHAVSDLARSVAAETGNHCIVLTAGYGLAKIITQLYDYFAQRGLIPQPAAAM